MSAATAALSSAFKVGRYTCTVSVPTPEPGKMASAVVEWSPRFPSGLSPRFLRQYIRRRNEVLTELAKRVGTIAIIE